MESRNEFLNEMNILYFHDSEEPKSCGYCKVEGTKKKTSYSSGFSTENLTPEMYENMMFLGWRRCGEYVYKPNLLRSCCKLYTMRLDIDRFKINKNQRRVMKNFRKFLKGEEIKKKTLNVDEDVDMKNVEMSNQDKIIDKYGEEIFQMFRKFLDIEDFINLVNFKVINSENEGHKFDFKVNLNKNIKFGNYSSNFLIVLYHYLSKTSKSENPSEDFKLKFRNTIEFYTAIYDLLNKFLNSCQTNWKIELSPKTGHLNFFSTSEISKKETEINKEKQKKKIFENSKVKLLKDENSLNLYKLDYFDEYVKEPVIEKEELKHTYSIELEPSSIYRKEKFEVYKKYQMAIHKDKEEEITPNRYINAWGTSNLKNGEKFNKVDKNKLLPQVLGTYDLVHKIDGKIFAVGVLDILTTSVSSVYLYYDPEFSFLNPGVFSAIREIEFIRSLRIHLNPDYKYYCMGFYCHTCPKMKYKGEYSPSQILCPSTLKFVDIQSVLKILNENNTPVLLPNGEKNPEVNFKGKEKSEILEKLDLHYQHMAFNAIAFIKKYIVAGSQEKLIKNIETTIEHVGKNNIKNFKLTIS